MTVKEIMIDDIMENYNFQKVQDVMIFLNWSWFGADESPSINELKDKAREHLTSAYDLSEQHQDNVAIANGGFHALARYSYDELEVFSLELMFSVANWDIDLIDLEEEDDSI